MTMALLTERLVLRPPTTEDFDDLYALTEPAAMRVYLGKAEPSRIDTFTRLMRNAGAWSLYGYGTFMVRERGSGDFVGNCGLFPTYRGLGEDFDHYPEAGWIIGINHWGKGYAMEAVSAALNWFDDTQGKQRTVCMIEPGNDASVKVANRLGYTRYATREFMGAELDLYERA